MGAAGEDGGDQVAGRDESVGGARVAGPQQRNPRIRRRLSVRFGTTPDLPGAGVTTNVSARGLGISAQAIYPAGTRIQAELRSGSGEVYRVGGIVVWSTRGALSLNVPGAMGVHIDTADASFQRLISPPGAT